MGEKDESTLKKEFRERDVQRMRNIITKKYGNKTVTQVGYEKVSEDHSEGDIWKENDKEWTIKSGIKMTHTKLDDIKKSMMMPLLCPECSGPMKTDYDKKYYPLHKKCFSCVIKMETELRRTGKYEAYMTNIIAGNIRTFIGEARDFVNDVVQLTDNIYTETGDKEDLSGESNKNALAAMWLEEINNLEEIVNAKTNS